MLTQGLRGVHDDDRVGVVLRNNNFSDRPFGLSCRRRDQFDSAVLFQSIEKVLQSNASFYTRDDMTLQINVISLPRGRVQLTGVSFEEFSKRKTGILITPNNDTNCLAYALVLAIAVIRKDPFLDELKKRQTYPTTER